MSPEAARGPENGMRGRVLLGKLIRGGIDPTPQLVPDLLYEGRIHSIAAPTGTGKTIIAEYLALQVIGRGRPVLYLDAENGPQVIASRLQEMGCDLDSLDHLFHYYPAELTLDPGGLTALMETVVDVGPALVVFDSLADFLVMAGMEENSNTDFTRWAAEVMQPLKDLGVASLVLDHTPKGGHGPRGASSKGAKVDVQWELEVELPFGRERTGEIKLTNSKDRECWLPKIVRFSVGGGVFARSYGTIDVPNPVTKMTDGASTIYDTIVSAGEKGARWSEMERAVNGSKGTVTRSLKELFERELVLKRDTRYYQAGPVPLVQDRSEKNPLPEPDWSGTGVGTDVYQNGTAIPNGTGDTGVVPLVPPPFRGGTSGTTDAQTGSAVPEPTGDFAPSSQGGTRRIGSEEKEGSGGEVGPANPSPAVGGTGADRRLTPDEAARVQRLIAEGMSPTFARAEVLGVPLE